MNQNSPLFFYAVFYSTFAIGGLLAGNTIVSNRKSNGYWITYGSFLIIFSVIGWKIKELV